MGCLVELTQSPDDAHRQSDLVTQIQAGAERANAALARELHDGMGGLMVAALIDLAWIERHLVSKPAESTEKLARISSGLRAAIDLERRIVEELRPTLLDHVGLFAALRWQLKSRCVARMIAYTDSLPAAELPFRADALIVLYRIAEEALTLVFRHEAVTYVSLALTASEGRMNMDFSDDGASALSIQHSSDRTLATLRHRVDILGGYLKIDEGAIHRSILTISVPIEKLLLPDHTETRTT